MSLCFKGKFISKDLFFSFYWNFKQILKLRTQKIIRIFKVKTFLAFTKFFVTFIAQIYVQESFF